MEASGCPEDSTGVLLRVSGYPEGSAGAPLEVSEASEGFTGAPGGVSKCPDTVAGIAWASDSISDEAREFYCAGIASIFPVVALN